MDQTNRIALDGAAIQEMREANETRAAFCRFLASLYLYELTDEQIEAFAHIEIAGDGTAIDEGLRAIKEYLRHRHGGTRQELAGGYARVFLGAGSYDRILAPPYESVFTSEERILMQDARDGAVTYYRRGGLDLPTTRPPKTISASSCSSPQSSRTARTRPLTGMTRCRWRTRCRWPAASSCTISRTGCRLCARPWTSSPRPISTAVSPR